MTLLRSALSCIACLALVTCSSTSENTSPPGDNSAEAIQSWIALNRAHLPTDYDEFGRLPVPYRRVVFGELPPAARSALFQTQYERYALAHPDMSPARRAVLERARELMTPDVYAIPQDSPEWEARIGAPQRELERQARAAFDRNEGARLFAMIGPEEPANP